MKEALTYPDQTNCPGCARRFHDDLTVWSVTFLDVTTLFCHSCIGDARRALGIGLRDIDFSNFGAVRP